SWNRAQRRISGSRRQRAQAFCGKENAVQQRRFGKHSFSIPEVLDADKVEAGYEDGVLSVTFPKTEVLKPCKIKIK
ncbi:MAG: Hsp20/alpha crystallin family protein, partial [Verrucomicrobia bacterium TMED71]